MHACIRRSKTDSNLPQSHNRANPRRAIVDARTATDCLSNSRLVCTSAVGDGYRATRIPSLSFLLSLSLFFPSPTPPPPARVKRIPTELGELPSLDQHSMRSPLRCGASPLRSSRLLPPGSLLRSFLQVLYSQSPSRCALITSSETYSTLHHYFRNFITVLRSVGR